jgi:hypothetical protein
MKLTAPSIPSGKLTLKRKKEGSEMCFSLYDYKALNSCVKNHKLLGYDMSGLEEEYDYETDHEHMQYGVQALTKDLYYAVKYFV